MDDDTSLLIFGASARAAAFSALRAGLRPWCADLFGDVDLQKRCTVVQVPATKYPQAFLELADIPVPGPWMYTGALENRPELVGAISHRRRLWGNGPKALKASRSPESLFSQFQSTGVPSPAVVRSPSNLPRTGRWLIKPRSGAGGVGVRLWNRTGAIRFLEDRHFLQEYVEGDSYAAIFVGLAENVRLLGVTRQLVGEPWLHAAAFQYCGSIGPVGVEPRLADAIRRMGEAVAGPATMADRGLLGLFGIDFILRDGLVWPVEVNPRYSASVEVLEYANRFPALAWHRSAFEPGGHEPTADASCYDGGFVAKAFLFARATFTFPGDGPWLAALGEPFHPWQLPAFADIPHSGEEIKAGKPILTYFCRGGTEAACLESLRQTAQDLDHWLFPP